MALLQVYGSTRIHADDIAFFYALDADFKSLKQESHLLGEPVKMGRQEVQRLELAGHRIYAAKMGSGPVVAATSTAALLARFRCDFALSIGPVGTLTDDLPIGCWREVRSFTAYQKGAWGKMGFQPSKVLDTFDPDASKAKQLRSRLKMPAFFPGEKGIDVASGEVFVASSDYREQLRSATGAQAVDMNLFGIETACGNLAVPLLSWRVVSDLANDNAGEAFRAFEYYDGAGGRAVAEIIRTLPVNPNAPEAYPELKKLLGQPADDPK